MPRQLRIEYEGAIYHVMSRGDRREDIVQGDADRELLDQNAGRSVREMRLADARVDGSARRVSLLASFHVSVGVA